MTDYVVELSNGATFATIRADETVGPVGFPTGGDQYFSTPQPILSINQVGQQFQIAGDFTYRFISGFSFQVQGSGGNNGTYTTASASYNGANTVITTNQTIASASAPYGSVVYQVPTTGAGSITPCSLVLWGQGTTNYGDYAAENFLHLLENFANTTAPPFPVAGQLWYNTSSSTLMSYNGTVWSSIGGGGGGGGAPTNSPYITVSSDPTLTAERTLLVQPGVLTLTDTGANGTLTVAVAAGGITATQIANSTITLAKLANVSTQTLLGRYTTGTGVPQQVTIGTGLNLDPTSGILTGTGAGSAPSSAEYILLSPNGSLTAERTLAVNSTLTITDGGAGSTVTISVATGGITATQIATGAVGAAQIAAGAVGTTQLAAGAVQLANIQNIATNTILGRYDAGTGAVESITLGSQFTAAGGILVLSGSALSGYAPLASANTFTGAQSVASVGISISGSSIATNAALSNTFEVTMTANATLANPTNTVNGETLVWHFTQDGTGGRTIAFGTNFKFPGGTAPTLSTAAGAVDVLTCSIAGGGQLRCNMINGFT